MSRYIKGDELQLFIADKTPCWATSHQLSLSDSLSSIKTKDHGFWGANDVGELTWELTAEMLYSEVDFEKMWDYYVATTPIKIKFARVKNFSPKGLTTVGGDVLAWIPDVKGLEGYATVSGLQAGANTGENATFSVTFTGTGCLKEYDNSITPYKLEVNYFVKSGKKITLWNKNVGWAITTAVDKDGGVHTFEDNTYLNSELFDKHITYTIYLISNTIPANLFKGITSMEDVVNPDDSRIVSIGDHAFDGSGIISFVDDAEKITSIGASAFSNATSLEEWLGASHFETISEGAFFNTPQLTEFNFGDSIVSIGASAFDCLTETSRNSFDAIFLTEFGPDLGQLALGNPNSLTVKLGNSTKATFLQNPTWTQYTNSTWTNY